MSESVSPAWTLNGCSDSRGSCVRKYLPAADCGAYKGWGGAAATCIGRKKNYTVQYFVVTACRFITKCDQVENMLFLSLSDMGTKFKATAYEGWA